ncbi:MAG: hypothetical protein P8R42_25305 [Candidatus Binatia bacterium]|nr:hypothetical protein [Candidatus Binatia bacterium]
MANRALDIAEFQMVARQVHVVFTRRRLRHVDRVNARRVLVRPQVRETGETEDRAPPLGEVDRGSRGALEGARRN